MNNDDIIKHIKKKIPVKERKNIKATVYREYGNKWTAAVLLKYSGGKGIGYTGAVSFLDVSFKTEAGAKKLVEIINKEFK